MYGRIQQQEPAFLVFFEGINKAVKKELKYTDKNQEPA